MDDLDDELVCQQNFRSCTVFDVVIACLVQEKVIRLVGPRLIFMTQKHNSKLNAVQSNLASKCNKMLIGASECADCWPPARIEIYNGG